mgnify:FL=1
MKHRSAVSFILVVGGLIAAGLQLLFWRFPMMPAAASLEASYVDGAWSGLLWVETAVYGLVMAFILWCLLAYRASHRSEQGAAFDRSRGRAVEAAWILVSTMLTLGLAALGAHELRAVIGRPEADIDVEVRAQQFSWEFYYPKEKQFGSSLFLERGKRHRIILTSADVVHSFWVPEFRLKQDAVPGKVIHLLMTPTKTGTYTLICSELCGREHTDMTALVQVLEHEDFEKALHEGF